MTFFNFVLLQWLARFCLVILFPFSTLDKILNYKNALAQANSSFVPGGNLLLIAGGLVEVVGSLCILTGWHDRLAAFFLAGYCVVTALLFHHFWSCGDFFSQNEDSKGRAHFWDFLKNFGLAGGLLFVVLLGHLTPVSSFLGQPFGSAPIVANLP